MIGTITVINKYKRPAGIDPKQIIYIGRPSVFGNPFPLSLGRKGCIAAYEGHFDAKMLKDTMLKQAVMTLVHRVAAGEHVYLECFCAPQECHGDVIKAYIERLNQ